MANPESLRDSLAKSRAELTEDENRSTQPANVNNGSPVNVKPATLRSRQSAGVGTCPTVIGLPPVSDESVSDFGFLDDMIIDSFPILEIKPCIQKFSGMELYRLEDAYDDYVNELYSLYNVKLHSPNKVVRVAYLGTSQPSESFNNDFEPSSLAEGIKIENRSIREAAFMTGATSVNQALEMAKNLSGQQGVGGAVSSAFGGMQKTLKNAEDQLKKTKTGSLIQQGAESSTRMAMGWGIDFPLIWKSCGWSASYSIQVRLYNPFPNDEKSTLDNIVSPLAALMMFVVPNTDNDYTFRWPWLCKFQSKGLFNVTSGFIKSIQVIKGGDDNNIALNQRVGIVDLKIELGTLYNTMMSSRKGSSSGIPTLVDWLDEYIERKEWVTPAPKADQAPSWSYVEGADVSTPIKDPNDVLVAQQQDKAFDTSGGEQSRQPTSRVPENQKNIFNVLEAEQDSQIIIA